MRVSKDIQNFHKVKVSNTYMHLLNGMPCAVCFSKLPALKTPLVLKHANKRPLFDKEKAMKGPSVKPMSPWAEAFANQPTMQNMGIRFCNLLFVHTCFHTPTSPPTGSVCKPRRLHPACSTNSGNCWTLLEDYQNTIMYFRLTHTSSFYQGGSMPPIQTSQLCEDSLQAPVYHKHWPLSRSNDDLHILRDGTKQQAAARSITFPIQVTRESSAGGGKAQMHKGASTRHGSQWALQWLG